MLYGYSYVYINIHIYVTFIYSVSFFYIVALRCHTGISHKLFSMLCHTLYDAIFHYVPEKRVYKEIFHRPLSFSCLISIQTPHP